MASWLLEADCSAGIDGRVPAACPGSGAPLAAPRPPRACTHPNQNQPQAMYNDGARVNWGGGIMGPKSQAAQKKRERALAKDAGLRV